MNVEIGAEAALFPEKEYINGITVEVYMRRLLHFKYPYKKENFIFFFINALSLTNAKKSLEVTLLTNIVCWFQNFARTFE